MTDRENEMKKMKIEVSRSNDDEHSHVFNIYVNGVLIDCVGHDVIATIIALGIKSFYEMPEDGNAIHLYRDELLKKGKLVFETVSVNL